MPPAPSVKGERPMKYYIATDRPLDIPAGSVVELTPEQYKVRKHAVIPSVPLPEKWEMAVFTATAPLQFKAGEKIGTTAEMPKSAKENIIPVVKAGILPAEAKMKK